MAEEVPTKSVPSRISSKRSRAAEVHNLSEKVCELMLFVVLGFDYIHAYVVFLVGPLMSGVELVEQRRRSRINEKMKALQNLIPNSNKVLKFLHPLFKGCTS